MASELPTLAVLKAIAPTPESKFSEVLDYDDLGPQTELHRPHEAKRMEKFWEAEEGSLEELSAGRQLAMFYMLMGANALRLAGSEENVDLWSERYTQSTTELYGRPDSVLAKTLWEQQQSGETAEMAPFAEAAEQVGIYMKAKYGAVFEALGLDEDAGPITAESAALRFENGLSQLAKDHDATWEDWTVHRNEKGDILSVDGSKKQIIVGMRRAEMTASQFKGLFAHEVLVHALRAVNGAKVDEQLRKGLPGYIDMEEGLGVFVEYSLTGTIPEKNIDRYVDIAYALGDIDGVMHTRQELLDQALNRAHRRNEAAATKKSDEQIKTEVYTHVNRIYRGSRGDEHIGIYSKDISYHKGFLELGEYVAQAIESTGDVDALMTYLMQGKFDPTDQAHVRYIQAAGL